MIATSRSRIFCKAADEKSHAPSADVLSISPVLILFRRRSTRAFCSAIWTCCFIWFASAPVIRATMAKMTSVIASLRFKMGSAIWGTRKKKSYTSR